MLEKNDARLQIISNETLDFLRNTQIITPSIYSSIFSKNALKHELDIGDENKLTDMHLDDKIEMCHNVHEKNSNNVIQLSDTTSKAISAIKEKDEITLSQVLQETEQLREEIDSLKEAVYKDELTRAYNRKWLYDKLVNRNDDTLTLSGTLVIIDLNFFKLINDTYGHIVGDKVLTFLSNQLQKTKQNVVRYGGDEFIVIYKDTDASTALANINAIREKIIAKKLKSADNTFRVSFSIGAYTFEEGAYLSDIIELADKNMYDDKVKIKKRIPGID